MNSLAEHDRDAPLYFAFLAIGTARLKPYLKALDVYKRTDDDMAIASWHYFSSPEDLCPSELLIGLLWLFPLVLICHRVCPYRM